jgi:hypothetical protein
MGARCTKGIVSFPSLAIEREGEREYRVVVIDILTVLPEQTNLICTEEVHQVRWDPIETLSTVYCYAILVVSSITDPAARRRARTSPR